MDWVCDNKAISFHRRDKLPSWKKDGINCCEDSQLTGHVTCYLGKKIIARSEIIVKSRTLGSR